MKNVYFRESKYVINKEEEEKKDLRVKQRKGREETAREQDSTNDTVVTRSG